MLLVQKCQVIFISLRYVIRQVPKRYTQPTLENKMEEKIKEANRLLDRAEEILKYIFDGIEKDEKPS